MKYKFLQSHLHGLADSAEFIIKNRYNLKGAVIYEKPFSTEVPWTPTFYWKTTTEYIACEVSEGPFPVILNQIYSDLIVSGLPIRVISAFPIDHSLTPRDYQAQIEKAKARGIGTLSVENGMKGNISYNGISIPLFHPKPNNQIYPRPLHGMINHIYHLYMNGDPVHGVQELGQVIENILVNVATQAKKSNKLTTGGFIANSSKYYAQNLLIEDLITDKILDKKILKKCGSFTDDRNKTSHKPKSIKEAQRLQANLKTLLSTGLSILEELPEQIKLAGFKLKV